MKANQINVIKPYKYHGQWVFDDPSVDLEREAFVAGADTLLDMRMATRCRRRGACSVLRFTIP